MNWKDLPVTQSEPNWSDRLGKERQVVSFSKAAAPCSPATKHTKNRLPEIKVAKKLRPPLIGKEVSSSEVFTLTVDGETIELVPSKTWCQLDHYKWTVRGKLPAEPAGLEIAADHVRMTGETIAVGDPEACAKLQRLCEEWLRFESENLVLACRKAHSQPAMAAAETPEPPMSRATSFHVELDKRGQVHIHCLQGRETLATVGLTVAGFTSLYQQGLLRHPRSLKTGALHDWVELDGELYSFENGHNDAVRLEQALNQCFTPVPVQSPAMEVTISLNAASATGFDIQFPFRVGGVTEMQRHHLDEKSLELLQDQEHCGLLRKDILIKLMPPDLVFKQKTADGGEQALAWCAENVVTLLSEEGRQTTIRLNQPLNFFRLSAAELTAVFNHPAINRHTTGTPQPPKTNDTPSPLPDLPGSQFVSSALPSFEPEAELAPIVYDEPAEAEQMALPAELKPPSQGQEAAQEKNREPVESEQPLPNLWLKEILSQPALQHDWFACLAYTKMAELFGNSTEGKFGPATCWFISLGDVQEITDPSFKGIFLTEKGSLGFLNQDQMARFCNQVAFLGCHKSPLEGIEVDLLAIGLDTSKRVAFIVSDNYREQFGVAQDVLGSVLDRLREYGAMISSVSETLASREPLEVVWTVPAEQSDPDNLQAVESTRAKERSL